MKRPLISILAVLLSLNTLPGCEGAVPEASPAISQEGNGEGEGEDEGTGQGQDKPLTMTLTIGTKTFNASLEDNATTTALLKMLPMTLHMSELGGNEKYHYLGSPLPTGTYSPGTINAGDIMLWGNNCIVVFYKTFKTSYSYTRIGKVDDPASLESALGTGSVTIKFE